MVADFRVPFREAMISIQCNGCGAELAVKIGELDKWKISADPKCAVCGKEYDETKKNSSALLNFVKSLVNARDASNGALKVFFRCATND